MRALYERAKFKNETVITIVGKDIQTDSRRVITMCHPINSDGKFLGAIFWESEKRETFERFVVPRSFQSSSLPFMEIKYPKQNEDVRGKSCALIECYTISSDDVAILEA